MSAYKSEFGGNIAGMRAVEDAIRATKQYTEGVGTMSNRHPSQGQEFRSKAFTKYYEVYPGINIDWNMPANVAIDWMFGDTPCVDVTFRYDYRMNKASVVVKGGPDAVTQLHKEIPGFSEALERVKTSVNATTAITTIPTVGYPDRQRTSSVPDPQPMANQVGHQP